MTTKRERDEKEDPKIREIGPMCGYGVRHFISILKLGDRKERAHKNEILQFIIQES